MASEDSPPTAPKSHGHRIRGRPVLPGKRGKDSGAGWGHERRPRGPLSLVSSVKSMLVSSILIGVSTAALIPFENCLPESYKNNIPVPLQWVPLFVDATFNTTDPKHRLEVTMWGNVTGAFFNVSLPPPGSPDWADPTKPDGKILDEPDPGVPHPMLTTLHSRINFLTYIPWNNNTNFCNDSLHNGTCPLAPVFEGNSSRFSTVPYGLPYVSMANDMEATYAFGSLSATFLVIYGDSRGTNIGCVSATITPDIGSLAWLIKFLPLIILCLVGFATVFASIFSPWGTADLFHWTSNYGRDPDLLRLVTPGFGDCLQQIQFIALTGALTLNYPGFYQPIVSQASWSALMFNHSFVAQAPGYASLQDGIYVLEGNYGLQRFAQLVGMGRVEDIWAGMMIYLLIIIASMVVLVQGGFLGQWIYRAVKKVPEEDLRDKNVPFTLGNMVRIVLNYFLFPIVALSTFQLVVAALSPAFTVALAVVTLILIIGFAAWLLFLIVTTKPRAFLFDDLHTVLLYGPLYNTYSDQSTAFALVPVVLAFVRGIAVGAVQPSGVAQVVLLAICEVVQILTLHAFRPFHSPTSMNAYHTLFSALRLTTVLLMVAFIPSLGVTEGQKGWIGYVILCLHGCVLLLVFFLNAIQTIVEVAARMAGAGGDDERGTLSKIFGMRQLSRRQGRREHGASRQSQLSSSAMLDSEIAAKAGFVSPGPRLRSESAASMGIVMQRRDRSESALSQIPPDVYGPSAYTPTTPGEASTFSFLPSPGIQVRTEGGLNAQPLDGFYRPPRQRRQTLDTAAASPGPSVGKGDSPQKRRSKLGVLQLAGPSEMDGQSLRGEPYTPSAALLTPRTDYSTREVDFYYNPRGQKLNSEAPNRKLGTGPADPTGPMSAAAGWFRNVLGAKSKGKTKGFEVVRSARMQPRRPPVAEDEDGAPPEGIPVAMGVLRNGPIESDDEDDMRRSKKGGATNSKSPDARLLGEEGPQRGRDAASSDRDDHDRASSTGWEQPGSSQNAPHVPRRSSKRASLTLSPGSSRLPFERTPSQKRLSGTSSMGATDFSQMDSHEGSGTGGEAYGFVQQGSVRRVEHHADHLGRAAEVVDERRG